MNPGSNSGQADSSNQIRESRVAVKPVEPRIDFEKHKIVRALIQSPLERGKSLLPVPKTRMYERNAVGGHVAFRGQPLELRQDFLSFVFLACQSICIGQLGAQH